MRIKAHAIGRWAALACLALLVLPSATRAQPTINTIAGTGTAGFNGDGQLATNAWLNFPREAAVDAQGNIYIADDTNNRIRKVALDGTISTFAGTGNVGYNGDNQPAFQANLANPTGVYAAPDGSVYISDTGHHRVRRVDTNGVITTVAGTGAAGFSGDGGDATLAQINRPAGIAVDSNGNIYIGDDNNDRIRKVDSNGIISTFVSGADFNSPYSIDVDAADNIYVAVRFRNFVQRVTPTGVITRVAGTGNPGSGGDGGDATLALLNEPQGVTVDPQGNVYIADERNFAIRRVDSVTGIITTFAGGNGQGFSGDAGPPAAAQLSFPQGVVFAGGDLYIVDSGNQRIRHVDISTDVTVWAPDTTATYNQSLRVPIYVSDTTGGGIVSAEVFVAYDSDLITAFSTSTTATLLSGDWSVETNIVSGSSSSIDTVKIAMATDDDALVGAGALIQIDFQVADVRAPDSSPLELTHVLFNDGTPNHIKQDGSVTLVGNTATISSLPAQVIPRETVTVTVVDVDEDTDGVPGTDQVSVTVTNSNNGDSLNLTLNEDGATAGTFVGSYSTVFGTSSSADALVQAQAGDALVSSYADALDGAGTGPTNRTAQTDVIGGDDGSVEITLVSQPGDPLYIEVADADLNTSFSSAETISVTVSNSRTAEVFTVVLTEVDLDDEVFFGSLPTLPGASTATDMNTAEDDVVTVTYDDVVTAVGDQQDRTATDDVIDPWGDADDNESLQAFDAAQVLIDVLSGGTHLSTNGRLAGNVDIDPVGTGITPFDASLILQKRVGLIASFPVQDPASTNHPQGDPASAKLIAEQRRLALVYGEGYISVFADERADILSGDILLRGVEGRAEMDAELGSFLSAARATEEGFRVVFAGPQSVDGPGELLRVYGVGPDRAEIARAAFNDGRINGAAAGSGRPISAPPTFALLPNVPNPFNPETSIHFELPNEGATLLIVYDALGQQVRLLVDEVRAAGRYAAHWDGRDALGKRVSSGVYFYELRAGEHRQMRRMLLLK